MASGYRDDDYTLDDDDIRRENRAYARRRREAENGVPKAKKPGKGKKNKRKPPGRAEQARQRQEWRAAWQYYANRLWNSAWWPEGAGVLIPASDRVNYHIDALARASGRLKATDLTLDARCGSDRKLHKIVQQALRDAVKHGHYRRGDPAKKQQKAWLYRVERDYPTFEKQRQREAGVAAAMLRKILLVGEALARKRKEPEFFTSDKDFAAEIGHSANAVSLAKPVLEKLGVGITMRRGEVAVTVARKGFKTHYRLTEAPRLADYATGTGDSQSPTADDAANAALDTPPPRDTAPPHDKPPSPPPSRDTLQRYFQAGFQVPPEDDLPAYRAIVADLAADDDLLPFGLAILVPEIAQQLTLVRCEQRPERQRAVLERLLRAFDPDHPEGLAELDWVRHLHRVNAERW